MIRRRAFTIAEVLISVALLAMLIGSAVWLFAYGGRATSRLSPRLAAQQSARKMVVRLLRELQEGMEVLTPAPGMTLPYAVIADKEGNLKWFYQSADGPPHRLFRFVNDPAPGQTELLLSNVKRLTFTSTSEGALTVNLLLEEEGQESAMLTTVRLRNIAAAEELW